MGSGKKKGGEGREETAGSAAKDKSSFAVTCGLLSQYLKDNKGGLQALVLAVPPPTPDAAAAGGGAFRPPTTMNLLSGLDAPAEQPSAAPEPLPTGSVLLSLEKASTTDTTVNNDKTDQQTKENARGQDAQPLTIFYGGKVVVFDNFPSTKVKDLLQIVSVGDGMDKLASSSAAPLSMPRPAHNNLSDLPIARRNSLHRFLEKRKGRIIAKAPYQVISSSVVPAKQAIMVTNLGSV